MGELLSQVRARRLVLIGDIHDNQALHRKILVFLESWARLPGTRNLFVEFLGLEDQGYLDRFNRGEISASALIQANCNRWPDSWLRLEEFDPSFYRDLLRLCRSMGILLRPMEPIPRLPLEARDTQMAKTLLQFRRKHPDAQIAVLVGHTHLLGKGHLVSLLQGRFGFPPEGKIPLLLPPPQGGSSGTGKDLLKRGNSYFLWNPGGWAKASGLGGRSETKAR
ncbi:MAG TPA: hypothetical protein ENK02_08360 [Planctomycetes bacterium]|nr:hypothetical protein [Planctomycetota bacterium]